MLIILDPSMFMYLVSFFLREIRTIQKVSDKIFLVGSFFFNKWQMIELARVSETVHCVTGRPYRVHYEMKFTKFSSLPLGGVTRCGNVNDDFKRCCLAISIYHHYTARLA